MALVAMDVQCWKDVIIQAALVLINGSNNTGHLGGWEKSSAHVDASEMQLLGRWLSSRDS